MENFNTGSEGATRRPAWIEYLESASRHLENVVRDPAQLQQQMENLSGEVEQAVTSLFRGNGSAQFANVTSTIANLVRNNANPGGAGQGRQGAGDAAELNAPVGTSTNGTVKRVADSNSDEPSSKNRRIEGVSVDDSAISGSEDVSSTSESVSREQVMNALDEALDLLDKALDGLEELDDTEEAEPDAAEQSDADGESEPDASGQSELDASGQSDASEASGQSDASEASESEASDKDDSSQQSDESNASDEDEDQNNNGGDLDARITRIIRTTYYSGSIYGDGTSISYTGSRKVKQTQSTMSDSTGRTTTRTVLSIVPGCTSFRLDTIENGLRIVMDGITVTIKPREGIPLDSIAVSLNREGALVIEM